MTVVVFDSVRPSRMVVKINLEVVFGPLQTSGHLHMKEAQILPIQDPGETQGEKPLDDLWRFAIYTRNTSGLDVLDFF